jgi:hypothetical protein
MIEMARFRLIYALFSNKWWDDCSQRALKFILWSMYFFLKRSEFSCKDSQDIHDLWVEKIHLEQTKIEYDVGL